MDKLRVFMFENVYVGSVAKIEEKKVSSVIEGLFKYYEKHTDKLPPANFETAQKEGAERGVCDYIAGMSDRFAVYTFNNLYVPRSWNKI